MAAPVRDPARLFAPPAVSVDRRADGTMVLRSPVPLRDGARVVGEYLERWAREAPERLFLQERGPDGRWRGPSYGEALDLVRRIGTWISAANLGPDRPVVILSDNSVEHALLTLGAMHVGVPVAAVSPAYSVMSQVFAKLGTIVDLAGPGLIYMPDHRRYGPALAAIRGRHDATIVTGSADGSEIGAVSFAALTESIDHDRVDARFRSTGPDTVAKLLFTSGSTGTPKGVLNTHRMLCSNQEAKAQVWPFLEVTPPVILDWLPWSHTFGGNHNFNLVLRNGGTLYIDGGRPLPPLFGQTLANLREVSPTIYFNVPRGYDLLVTALRDDRDLRERFFRNLQLIFYAGAALPQNLWDALEALAIETTGSMVPMTSAWGSTETSPLAADCHFQAARSGVIGLPVPGTELKLVPNGEKLEVRVRGPNVTPGYWRRPDLTAAHFDDEGFYQIGDAVRMADPDRPELGLVFDGRVAEDFKLDTGTWVSVGTLRIKGIAALAPIAQDIVVTGHDRPDAGFLVFANVAECRRIAGALGTDRSDEAVVADPTVRQIVTQGLEALRAGGIGSSGFATRALLMVEPPSIDQSEITDKGYLNQRAVLGRRADLVELLYSGREDPRIVTLPGAITRPAPSGSGQTRG